MKRKFIIDKEINLNESDFLKTKTYSDNLCRIIENTDENKVFTIGLFGSWGSGKSSIIETATKGFNQAKVKFISYDAWQYANDSFRRMFLRKIRKDLGFDETELMKKFYENESADIGNRFQLSTTRLSWILGGILLAIGLVWAVPFELDYKMPIYSLLSIIGLFITVISGAFHQLKVSITKPLFFAPEQFESCFKEMISVSLKKYKWFENILFTIAGDKTVRGLDKLVIVIDNIDRCNNDVAYQLLTDIKTFLASDSYSIVFVIPVDDEALRKHLFKLNNHSDEDISVKEKEEFLRKFFNVIIRIKPYLETDMFSFAKKINEKYSLDFKMDTLSLAAKEYSTNPRRVIQLFNNLTSELSNYSEEFAKQHETLICAVIILREEFSAYYKEVVNFPRIFLEDIELTEPDPKRERIERFNRITRSIRTNVSPSHLTYILTNSNSIFEDLSTDIKDSIESFDFAKTLESVKDHSTRVYEFIVHRARFCLQNNLNNDLVGYFDLVSQINLNIEIDRATNSRFNDVFEQKIDYIIEHANSFDTLCQYALIQEEQNLKSLKRIITDKIANTNSGVDFWPKLFNAVIKHFQDKETCLKLSETYTNNFKAINTETRLSKEQYVNLISSGFIENRIDEIDGLSVSSNSYRSLSDIIANKENLNPLTIEKLFDKINQISGDTLNKATEEIIELINYMNSFLNLLPDRILSDTHPALETLYTKTFKRKMAHYSYPSSRNHDRQVDLVDECLGNDDYLERCIVFIMGAYRITNERLAIVEPLGKLHEKRAILNPIFKDLVKKGFALRSIHEFILNDTKYEDSVTLELLAHIFSIKTSQNYLVAREKALAKIDSLLEYASNNNSTDVYRLLEDLSKSEFYKGIILECVVSKPADFINKLPTFLLKLSINSFDSLSYLNYKDNFSFLEVVAANGTQHQVHCLVLILNQKIDSNERFTDVVSVASKIKSIKQLDKNLLKSHLESFKENHQEGMTEGEKEKLKSLIKQFG